MKENVYINTGIADKNGPAYRVYTYVRSLDEAGSGRVRFSITAAAMYLGLARGSVLRNLKLAVQAGLLFDFHNRGGFVTTCYISTLKLKILDTALRVLVPTALALNYLKQVATRAEACQRTRQHHNKLRRLPRRRRSDEMHGKQILTYEHLLADNCRWAMRYRNGVCITHPQLVHTGASQQTVANALGRHRRTVNRRLKFCNEHLCAQPHLRVHRLHNLSDLPGEVQDGLMDNSRFGKYTLAPGGVVWENSTCIYPFEPFGFGPDPDSEGPGDGPGDGPGVFARNSPFNSLRSLNGELAILAAPRRPRLRVARVRPASQR